MNELLVCQESKRNHLFTYQSFKVAITDVSSRRNGDLRPLLLLAEKPVQLPTFRPLFSEKYVENNVFWNAFLMVVSHLDFALGEIMIQIVRELK
jgi:hypothetical protein